MHPCLRVDEIVRLVASELVASGSKGTAAALARCCKGFEDPVLDSLWEDGGWLAKLLGVLPKDAWDCREDSVSLFCVVTMFAF